MAFLSIQVCFYTFLKTGLTDLGSSISGPKRYDYSPSSDSWVYSRDGRALGDLLSTELSTALGQKVELELEGVSEITAE